jgi:hypothetical protein
MIRSVPRTALIVLSLAWLPSCADDYYRLVKSPDGHWWYDLTCSSKGACLEDARAACKSDFEIKDSNAADTFGISASKRFADVTTTATRSHTDLEVLVQCAHEVVPPGTNRTVERICRKDPSMRTNMEQGVSCIPEPGLATEAHPAP